MLKEPGIKEVQLRYIIHNAVFIAIILAAALGTSAQTASFPASSTQTSTTGSAPNGFRAGHILVRFKTTPAQAVLDQLNTAFGAKAVGKIAGIGVTHLQVPGSGLALLNHLQKRSDVEFAEFDSYVRAFVTPNDPYFSTVYTTSHNGSTAQWAPQAVSAPSAWGMTGGDRNIVIAIVDTGVDDTHPDLASKIVGEYNFVKGETVHDGFGHGSHVAGIAAAATDNRTGIAGICWNCGILSVKVLNNQGGGYTSDVASGITYAASHGARVISLSLGGNGRTQTMDSALNYAVANNALPVCAMGNNGESQFIPEPAYWYPCLTVIATDQSGARASFSNYGVKADVAAPGVAILSTMPTYPVTLTTSYGYQTNYDALSGTSMATPMVSGIAGLVLSMNPNLTPSQLKGIIMAAAGDGWTDNLAFGIVNAATATSMAIHSDYTPPSANLTSPAEGATIFGLTTFQAAPIDDTSVHHVDIIQNDTRLMRPLVGVSTTTGSGKTATTTPAWTMYWASTVVWNGSETVSAVASDAFGNPSAPQNFDFTVQNQLVSQSWTKNVCWPSTSTCNLFTSWLPMTIGVATEAAVHLHGTVTYSSQKNVKDSSFWIQVANPSIAWYCGGNVTTVDCYPGLLLEPDGTKKSYSNFSGSQIDVTPNNGNPASETGTVQWTVTYPQ